MGMDAKHRFIVVFFRSFTVRAIPQCRLCDCQLCPQPCNCCVFACKRGVSALNFCNEKLVSLRQTPSESNLLVHRLFTIVRQQSRAFRGWHILVRRKRPAAWRNDGIKRDE